MSETILCDLSDATTVIEEARDEWVIDTLLALGIDEETVELGFSDGEDYDEFRYRMSNVGIDVELHSNGDVDIYKKVWYTGPTEEQSGWLPPKKEHLVAQWKAPERVKRITKDGKRMYYELSLRCWSVKNMRKL